MDPSPELIITFKVDEKVEPPSFIIKLYLQPKYCSHKSSSPTAWIHVQQLVPELKTL